MASAEVHLSGTSRKSAKTGHSSNRVREHTAKLRLTSGHRLSEPVLVNAGVQNRWLARTRTNVSGLLDPSLKSLVPRIGTQKVYAAMHQPTESTFDSRYNIPTMPTTNSVEVLSTPTIKL